MTSSLIIASYNRVKQLSLGLSTILTQKVIPSEVIIVDDGSSDATRTFIETMQKLWGKDLLRYIYLPFPEPRISCHARNVGIKAATGEIIMFTEPEALHVGNTIEQMFHAMMYEYPENTVLSSQVWTMGEKVYNSLTPDYFDHPEKILEHEYAFLTDGGNMENKKAPDADWGITGERWCNAGVFFGTRKEWLVQVGGFDESFTGHGFDDFDLFNRLAIIGHGIQKLDTMPVIHQWHEKGFYPYNIYEAAEKNGKISEANIHAGIYAVNQGKDWGKA